MPRTINYSLCWEDQDILKILHQEGHEILMIGSGGCLSFSSLAFQDVIAHIVDVNELQIKLIRLKVCAFKNLNYDECMYFFGTFTPPKKSLDRINILLHLLKYLPEDYQFVEDITVFASGKDGIFTAGTPIGKTTDYGAVDLFVDPNQLSFVTVNLIKPTKEVF